MVRRSTDNRASSISEHGVRVRPGDFFTAFSAAEVEQSIPRRFERQVAKYPNHLAVKRNDQAVSYRELNRLANRIARLLLSLSATREEPVAIVADNHTKALAGILGILKAGKVYVPLDASFSPAWARFIFDDTEPAIVLATSGTLPLAEQWSSSRCRVIDIENLNAHTSDDNPEVVIAPTALAHILYTSGSTGQPKGVADNHRNILHHVMRVTNSTFISAQDRMTLLRPPNSSGALMNALAALLNGTTLFPMDVKDIGLDGMADWLIREKITFFHSGGTVFRHFAQLLTGAEQFPHLRLIRLSSGRISKIDVELFKKYFSHCVLLHVLSSTEANTYRMCFLDKNSELKDGAVPVGYPVKDMEVVILDDTGNELPENSAGEIAIRSAYLFPYYWRNPQLTKASFLPDPRREDARIFRTGDLGILRPDSCLEYLGRKDFRLKIRGHSIQSEEVEVALLKITEIKQAVVLARQDDYGDDRLVAYIVFNHKANPSISRLREHLKENLPDYMLPSTFMVLDSLPLMPNGKVNRQELPPPTRQRPQLSSPLVAPQSPVEVVVAKRWSKVLGVEPIGLHDGFFDLGGDSLLASKIVSSLSSIFPRSLSLSEFLQAPTVAGLASLLVAKELTPGQADRVAGATLQVESMSTAEIEAAISAERAKRNHGQSDSRPAEDE